MSTSFQEAVIGGIQEIANVSQTSVIAQKDRTAFGFFTPAGFCMIGYTKYRPENGYFDLRWRVFIGEVTPAFSPGEALKINHSYPETPYGLVQLSGRELLTITDNYRFLVSWGPTEIQEIIKVRFGGAFSTSLALPGVKPLSEQFFQQVLQDAGFSQLLSKPV